jgi:hypothetical protein
MNILQKKEIETLKTANVVSANQANENLSVPSTRFVSSTYFSKFIEFRTLCDLCDTDSGLRLL